jgi:peptidoglycan/LPS O-acetylase OafA/YrhL
LQYIVVFPWLRRLPDKIGASATLVIGAVCAWASGWYMFYIVDAGKAVLGENIQWPGWYYHWIFAPRALWHVLAGIAVARFWNAKISTKVTALACAITLLGGFATVIARGAHNDVYGPIRELSVIQLVDVPLAVALLGIFRHLPLPRVLHKGLAFCGVWSWGIYLGHLLVHELVRISGFKAGLAPQVDRALYAVFLLVTGTIIAVVAEWTRARVAQLRVGNSAA